MTRAGESERRRLHDTFAELCAIASPSRSERACADTVIARLHACGVEVDEDGAGAALGGDTGNLLARIPGSGEGHVLLCGHLDTVPVAGPIEPVVREGAWESAGETILGADNKVAVATMLVVAERLARVPARTGVELLFTVGEEVALSGAKEFEVGRLRSTLGVTFDSAMALGGIVVASPTYYRLTAEFHGVAAHAGLRPERGRNAIVAAAHAIASMTLGRLDDETTANIGLIEGGTAVNVVAERCRLAGEVRSIDAARAERVASELADRLADAANDPRWECDLDLEVERLFDGYRVRPSSPELELAGGALRDCGYEPSQIVTGGGSDANVLRSRGLGVLNLANGTERNHEPDERVALSSLEGILDVAFALIERAGA